MSRTLVNRLIAVVVATGIFLGWIWSDKSLAHPLTAGEPKKKEIAGGATLVKALFGNKACASDGCHGNTKPTAEKEDVFKGFKAILSRRNELNVWEENDKHKRATEFLTLKRGKQIAKLMKIEGPITDPKSELTNTGWKQCIVCHGVVVENKDDIDPDSFGPADRIDSGVSCIVCHGGYQNWYEKHSPAVKNLWNTYTAKKKQKEFGLQDLWNPANRAKLCCSCHVGNADEGKVVTHEMYAAGHPPLPSFEILTFSDAMPRHWETPAEKYKRLPKYETRFKEIYGFSEEYDLQQTRLLLTSAVVAFRNSVALIAAHAKPKNGQVDQFAWPEFALYDCYACHHDLKSKSWRQERGYAGKPGRPPMTAWSTALLPLALQHARVAGNDLPADFADKLKDLKAVFSNVPFGDRGETAAKALILLESSETLLKIVQDTPLDHAKARELPAMLASRSTKDLLDFDSARQVSWGVKALLGELQPSALKGEAKTAYGSLDKNLKLELLKGPNPIAGAFLDDVLLKLDGYDPDDFQKNMKIIAAAIEKQK